MPLTFSDFYEFIEFWNLCQLENSTGFHHFLGLFIDVGTNYSVLDHTNLSFIYEDILAPGPNSDGEFVSYEFFMFLSCTRIILVQSPLLKSLQII